MGYLTQRWAKRGVVSGLVAWVAAVAVIGVLLASCSTGVNDADGWRQAVRGGHSCSELRQIARGLPDAVDRTEVERDLRHAGCTQMEPPTSSQDTDRAR